MKKCEVCGSDEIATVATAREGSYTECTKCGKRTYIPSYDDLVYRVAELERQLKIAREYEILWNMTHSATDEVVA
jgi:hypothetical protein